VIIGAVLALRGRAAASGVMAGLAVTNKLWGLLALVPLVLAVPRRGWVRAATAAGLTILVLYAPLAIADPSRFHGAVTSANELGTIPGTAGPTNAWWFFMDLRPFQQAVGVRDGTVVSIPARGYALGGTLGRISHPLVILLSVALALLWARRRRDGDPDVLLLLALIFLMRCVLDPNNYSYYHLPFLTCLIAYEGLARGFPIFGIVSAACLQAIISISPHVSSPAAITWIYLAWALPTMAGLAFLLCLRSRSTPPTRRSPISRRLATGSATG
jgi:hypothetical protein